MPYTIDYLNEDSVGSLFTSGNFTDDLHRYLGLDPALNASDQPLNVTDLLEDCIHIVEQDQSRFILRKPVTFQLPLDVFCADDGLVYLPFGPVTSLTTFQYLDADGNTQNVSSSSYTLYTGEVSQLYAEDWTSVLDFSNTVPYPVTLTYTTGYSSFDEIPRSTLRALKILCYYEFNFRSSGEKPIDLPLSYAHHVAQAALSNHRVLALL